jgi:hypothetical protein
MLHVFPTNRVKFGHENKKTTDNLGQREYAEVMCKYKLYVKVGSRSYT